MLGKNLIQAASGTAGGSGGVLGIEDVFSTWLYTGNGGTQTITNEIDLAGKGGLVWIKCRSVGFEPELFDTARGATKRLSSASSDAELTMTGGLNAFNGTGFSIGNSSGINFNNSKIVSWTFRKAAKFFDVVTYTGTGANRSIAHSLGSVPGTIIIKRTDAAENWVVWHRSLGVSDYLSLNSTAGKQTNTFVFNTLPTSSLFYVGANGLVNQTGGTYVAYIFAHDAGGFGEDGNQNVISCGTFTGSATVNLGWEPQWVVFKRTDAVSGWIVEDNMRNLPIASNNGNSKFLYLDATNTELTGSNAFVTQTGFTGNFSTGTWVYIAIRRGPMKTPTEGTKVFTALTYTGNDADRVLSTSGVLPDLVAVMSRNVNGVKYLFDRLRRGEYYFTPTDTAAQTSSAGSVYFDNQNLRLGTSSVTNTSVRNYVAHVFRRAPGFLDILGYTGNNQNQTISHNLGTTPGFIIVKGTSATNDIWCYHEAMPNATNTGVRLNNSSVLPTYGFDIWTPTSTTFQANYAEAGRSISGVKYIAYLFATCPGVSKVGGYTGTGTTLDVDCGFTTGARYVLIKQAGATNDWYVWDTARGIVSGNDPYLLMNTMASESISTDYIDPLSSGFQISSTAPAAINANGGSYIFLAIA